MLDIRLKGLLPLLGAASISEAGVFAGIPSVNVQLVLAAAMFVAYPMIEGSPAAAPSVSELQVYVVPSTVNE